MIKNPCQSAIIILTYFKCWNRILPKAKTILIHSPVPFFLIHLRKGMYINNTVAFNKVFQNFLMKNLDFQIF